MARKFSAFTDGLTDQSPTDTLVGLDISLSASAQNTYWTLNSLFSVITRNITDGALRFQGFAAPSVSAAGQCSIYFDSSSNTLKLSQNTGAYADVRSGTVTVPQGGTGLTTLTAYALMAAGTTATGNMQQVSGVGTAGQVLTSNGAGALPSWQAAGAGTIGGSIAVNQVAVGSGVDTIAGSSAITYDSGIFALPSASGLSIGRATPRDSAAPALHMEGTLPLFSMYETDGPSNEKMWEITASGGQLVFRTQNDAISSSDDFLYVNRTAAVVDNITIPVILSLGGTPIATSERFALQLYRAGDSELVIQSLKTGTDSSDDNIDGAVNVKHGQAYAATAGYAHTYQVYAEAGLAGLVLGCNNFPGVVAPYNPTGLDLGNGFVRFELGPLWPLSEKARFNNQGDFLFSASSVSTYTASQSGTTVTATVGTFSASDVGKYFSWVGSQSFVDRIIGFTDATNVTVETSRTIASQSGRTVTYKVSATYTGNFLVGNSALVGTSGVGVLALGNGTVPTTSPADTSQIYSADINGTAGQAGAHLRNEISTSALILPGTRYKTTTGDPSDTFEGMMVINTSDNAFKVYADGAWRTITTW